MNDFADFKRFLNTYVTTQRAQGRNTKPRLSMHTLLLADVLHAHGVLRLHGGMPSLVLSTDATKLGLFWPNVGQIEDFCIWLDMDGGHTLQTRAGEHAPSATTDAKEALVDLLKQMQGRV